MQRSTSSIRHRASRLGIADYHNPKLSGEAHPQWTGGHNAALQRRYKKLDAERRSQNKRKINPPWTVDEDNYLISTIQTSTIQQIADNLGRSKGSVTYRQKQLNLKGRGSSWQQSGNNHHQWKGGRIASFYRSKYNLNLTDYQKLVETQNNRCAICDRHAIELRRGLFIDHNHDTNIVRGLLCVDCNFLLGNAKDDVSVLERAVTYLKNNGTMTE